MGVESPLIQNKRHVWLRYNVNDVHSILPVCLLAATQIKKGDLQSRQCMGGSDANHAGVIYKGTKTAVNGQTSPVSTMCICDLSWHLRTPAPRGHASVGAEAAIMSGSCRRPKGALACQHLLTAHR